MLDGVTFAEQCTTVGVKPKLQAHHIGYKGLQ